MDDLLPLLMRVGKFVLASGLLTLLYLLLFRGKASFNNCRLYLLSIPILAVLVSQFSLRWDISLPDSILVSQLVPLRPISEAASQTIQEEMVAPAAQVTGESLKAFVPAVRFSWGKHGWMVVYAVVTLFLLFVFFRQIGKVLRLRKEGMRRRVDGIEVVVNPAVPTPFSFFKTVFLSDSLQESKLDLVLKHERYHIIHKHYIDVLLVQLLVRLAWFNPIHWWIRKELVSVNEFQADQSVLNEGFDMYRYQTVILEEVMATNPFLASGLNDSFTKRRFVMMKQQPTLRYKALRRLLPVPVLMGLFILFSFEIHGTNDPQKMTPVARNLLYLNEMGTGWDEESPVCVLSSSYKEVLSKNVDKPTYSHVFFSYRLNEDTLVSKQVVESDLRSLSDIIKSVVGEGEKLNAAKSSYASMSALIYYLNYHIGNLKIETVPCKPSKALAMDKLERSNALEELESLGLLAGKVASSSLDATDKLIKFKYLVFILTANPLAWTYLEPHLIAIALEGKTTQKNIKFFRLGRGRMRNLINDSRIWNSAPRFKPSQVSVCSKDVGFTSDGISHIRCTRKDTRVTLHCKVSGNEWWFYFDKGTSLIDKATGDIFLIKGVERNIPLNQTIVVTGCSNRYVEFTLIFPPLPESVKAVDMREFIADRSNIMSDVGGESHYDNLVLKEYALK